MILTENYKQHVDKGVSTFFTEILSRCSLRTNGNGQIGGFFVYWKAKTILNSR